MFHVLVKWKWKRESESESEKMNVRKWKWTWESESEKMKVKIRKWMWESEKANLFVCITFSLSLSHIYFHFLHGNSMATGWKLLLTFTFSLSLSQPFFLCVSADLALSHANCQSDNRWFFIPLPLSSETSREYLSSAGFTVGSSIYSHHTGALCIRQVMVVPIFLHLPELCIMGSFLFAHVSPA